MKTEKYVTSKQNQDRAGWAKDVLKVAADVLGMSLKHEAPDVIADVLCDIRHYCTQNGIKFEDCFCNANANYLIESRGEE